MFGFTGFGAEAGDEFFNFGHAFLLFFIHTLLLRQFFCTDAFVGAVVAGIQRQALLVQVHNVVGYTVDKIAVVGNKQQRTRIIFQVLLQPHGCF